MQISREILTYEFNVIENIKKYSALNSKVELEFYLKVSFFEILSKMKDFPNLGNFILRILTR